ncbi:MAG: hypothetical protein ACTSPW_11970 [Promethearchaeota archaeon]
MKIIWTKEKVKYTKELYIMIVFCIIAVLFIYFYYLKDILIAYELVPDLLYISIIIFIRILIMSLLIIVIFRHWLSQENVYLDDLPFLIGLFFLASTFGKVLDLLHYFIAFTVSESEILLFLKFRYLLIIFAALPLLYIGISLILYIRDFSKENIKRYSLIIILISSITEILLIFLAINMFFVGLMLPIILFPPLLMLIILFAFAFKQKRLSQVHPLILSIGFIICLFSQVLRPILQILLIPTGSTASNSELIGGVLYVLISEIVSIFAFIIIFIGLLIKAKYFKT